LFEREDIAALKNLVFVKKNGQPMKDIRTAWCFALERAKLEDADIVPHDFRRTAITRWTAAKIPRDFVMAASGHKPNGVHDKYFNPADEELVAAFEKFMLPPEQRSVQPAAEARAAGAP